MIRKLLLFSIAFIATLGAGAKSYNYTTVEGDPMRTRIYTLDNGLTVYMSVNKEKPRIMVSAAVRTGSRNDPAETTGLAHYLEHLMFKGTTHFGTSNLEAERPLLNEIKNLYEKYRKITNPAERKKVYHQIDSVSQLAAKYNIPNEYDKLMASIGAEGSNAYTSNDVTCYHEDIPANELDNWLKVQSDRFQNMVIRGFHTELEAVYEEYNIGLTSDSRKEWAALNKKLYPTHPYGTQTTIGTQEHLKNPSIVNIENYYHRYYVPNNIAICMSGDFNPDEAIALIDKYFGSWKKSETLCRPEYQPQAEYASPVDTCVIGLEAENVMLGWRAKGDADYQSDTLEVIAEILANGNAGIMELNLEQKMKLTSASAFYDGMCDYGQFDLEGVPVQGQSLEDVRGLLLSQIDSLKQGKFSDELLPAVINNMKLRFQASMLSNESRSQKYVYAYVNNENWKDNVNSINRKSGMTKAQIVDFANSFFKDNYVCVYKRQGNDSTIKKIEKPEITAIPTNNDKQSEFLREVSTTEVEPIQPQFLDFKKDLSITKTKTGLPVIYKQNNTDGIFSLVYKFDFGACADNRYNIAASYLNYIGTDKKSSERIKQDFYNIACSYSMYVSDRNTYIILSGLNENMPKAVALLEDYLCNAKGNKESYDQFVKIILKKRADEKAEQEANFQALLAYAHNGAYNDVRNQVSSADLQNGSPETYTDLLNNIFKYKHSVLYFGATPEKAFLKILTKAHPTSKKFASAPVNKVYKAETTSKNEVWIAPYDAKNIYMVMYRCDNKLWQPENAPIIKLFNEYFGGGMNTIVFQELRESRGLAYHASASYRQPSVVDDPEWAYTLIISQNDKMPECVRVFNNILDTMPMNSAAFELAKQGIMKKLASSRTTRADVIDAYIAAQDRGIDYDINKLIYEKVPTLTLQDIANFEKSTMANKPYRYIIVGDENNLDVKFLEGIAPIKRFTTDEIFEN